MLSILILLETDNSWFLNEWLELWSYIIFFDEIDYAIEDLSLSYIKLEYRESKCSSGSSLGN